MQLSVSNNAGNQVSKPRFWKAEWSLTGDMTMKPTGITSPPIPYLIW